LTLEWLNNIIYHCGGKSELSSGFAPDNQMHKDKRPDIVYQSARVYELLWRKQHEDIYG